MNEKTNVGWILRIVLLSIGISIAFTFVSEVALGGTGFVVSLLFLIVFILIGVIFDIIGIAVASASETPFHSMASHHEKGAAEAIRLIKNAGRVSSICNDVIGDISGIVSGSMVAAIGTMLMGKVPFSKVVLQLALSGLVAGLTIGGKAVGKIAAIKNSTKIVLNVGKLLEFLSGLFQKQGARP